MNGEAPMADIVSRTYSEQGRSEHERIFGRPKPKPARSIEVLGHRTVTDESMPLDAIDIVTPKHRIRITGLKQG